MYTVDSDPVITKQQTPVAPRRAAAAFRGWLTHGVLAKRIKNVKGLADYLGTSPDSVLELLYDQETVAELGGRIAQVLRTYLDEHGLHLVIEAGTLGESAVLPKPSLGGLVDDLIAEWRAEPHTGVLATLSPDGLRRLIMLLANGVLSQVGLHALLETIEDDEGDHSDGSS